MTTYLAADSTVPGWLSGWLGLVVVVLGILGLAASAAAYLRASYAKATVSTLAESNAALRGSIDDMEREARRKDEAHAVRLHDEAAERVKVTVRLEAIERENHTLREVVQGKADIERVILVVEDHHHEVLEDRRAFHGEWRGEIDKIHGALDKVALSVASIDTSQKAVRSMTGKMYAATTGDKT